MTPIIHFKTKYIFRCKEQKKHKIIIDNVLERIINKSKITTMRVKPKKLRGHNIYQGSRFKPINTGIVIKFFKIDIITLFKLLNVYPKNKSHDIIIKDLGLTTEELDEIENTNQMSLRKCFSYGLYTLDPKNKAIPFDEFIQEPIYLLHFHVRENKLENYF